MDIDPNDILSTNVFISEPLLNFNENKDKNKNFQKYYISKNEQELRDKAYQVLDPQKFYGNESSSIVQKENYIRTKREKRTFVSVDSRDRDKTVYSKPNHFKIFLGKTYYNVKTIKLASLEFPNTNAVINSKNNMIYWRNQEDIDLDYTMNINNETAYPIYSVQLRTGSYTASTLQHEMADKLQLVRRTQGVSGGSSVVGDFHYFLVDLDIDTDIVTFTSLILTQLPNNPFSTTLNSNVIIVNAPSHGYSNNEFIYIYGPKQVAGIAATTLTGFFQITVLSANVFTFEIPEKAGGNVLQGGGNTVKTGKKAPFQLLWGDNAKTVAQNIGYPLENSSELIATYISSLQNVIQMSIYLSEVHNYIRNAYYLGSYINIGYLSGVNFITSVSYRISNIINNTSVIVLIPDITVPVNLTNSSTATHISFDGITYFQTSSYSIFSNNSILITTAQDHNFTVNNITDEITVYDTIDPEVYNDYNYDGTYAISSIISSTEIITPGNLVDLNLHPSGNYGKIPRYTPITTHTCKITNLVPEFLSGYVKITTDIPHLLLAGDYVYLNNILSTPILKEISYVISSVIDDYNFLIPLTLSSVELSESSFIGTGLIALSIPLHRFNILSSITQIGTTVLIQTVVPHNLTTGDTIRISGTNTSPSLDGGGYSVIVLASDTFSITYVPVLTIPSTITGVLGLSNDFYLYNCEDVGGISKTQLNGINFTVREILDENTFTFMALNTFAQYTETGGGSGVYISSLKHGFNGIQTNTKNNILNRSINLEGENYSFLTCPQLDTVVNTGDVKNVFARISLDQAPGYVCYSYLSNPKHFNDVPLSVLSELEFSVVNYDGSYYDFSDLDFSFTLEITEVIDESTAFNLSTKRGIIDSS